LHRAQCRFGMNSQRPCGRSFRSERPNS
jgi:hypothetical protein